VAGYGQHGSTHALVGREADREPQATLPQVVNQRVGGPAGVGADQDRLVASGPWELRQGQVDDLDVVGGGVGAGVA